MSLKEQINKNRLPKHVAIIMDGNGRWARQRGNKRVFGHKNGVTAVRDTVEGAAEIGIKYLTLYAFSTENWNRPRNEIDALMQLLVSSLNAEIKTLMKNNVSLLTIGDTESLPPNVKNKLHAVIDKTSANSGLYLILALSYSARWEICEATKKMLKDYKNDKFNLNDVDDNKIRCYLSTAKYPDPELLIRTSGEYRISNFLLWQIAYSELYFTETLWPDFRRENLFEAIINFQKRERRFGKTSEQITENKG